MSYDVFHPLVKPPWNGFAPRALVHTAVWSSALVGRRLLRKV